MVFCLTYSLLICCISPFRVQLMTYCEGVVEAFSFAMLQKKDQAGSGLESLLDGLLKKTPALAGTRINQSPTASRFNQGP